MPEGRRDNDNESRVFWQISQELTQRLRADPQDAEIGNLIEDVKAMLHASDSATIKARCRRLLADVDGGSGRQADCRR